MSWKVLMRLFSLSRGDYFVIMYGRDDIRASEWMNS